MSAVTESDERDYADRPKSGDDLSAAVARTGILKWVGSARVWEYKDRGSGGRKSPSGVQGQSPCPGRRSRDF